MLIFNELKKSEKPWIRLALFQEFLKLPPNSGEILDLKKTTANHPLIKKIINECKSWPGYPLKRHNDAKHIVQKIGFLADIGLDRQNKNIAAVCQKLLSHQSEDGGFQTQVLIPRVFGGNDRPEWIWILCDFPLMVFHCPLLSSFLAGCDLPANALEPSGAPLMTQVFSRIPRRVILFPSGTFPRQSRRLCLSFLSAHLPRTARLRQDTRRTIRLNSRQALTMGGPG